MAGNLKSQWITQFSEVLHLHHPETREKDMKEAIAMFKGCEQVEKSGGFSAIEIAELFGDLLPAVKASGIKYIRRIDVRDCAIDFWLKTLEYLKFDELQFVFGFEITHWVFRGVPYTYWDHINYLWKMRPYIPRCKVIYIKLYQNPTVKQMNEILDVLNDYPEVEFNLMNWMGDDLVIPQSIELPGNIKVYNENQMSTFINSHRALMQNDK
jgi:hypothetical protein